MARTVRISCLIVIAVFVAVGLAVAVAFLPLLIALGVLAGLAVLCLHEESRTGSEEPGCNRKRLAVIVAAAVVVACYAAIGMTTLWGGGATALASAAVLGVFCLRRLRHGRMRTGEYDRPEFPFAGRPGPAEPKTMPLLPNDPTTLDLDDLCRAWRLSYLLVENAHGPGELEHAARLRRRYLDELARRHPAGFRRWIDDGARAAGDPSRYLRPSGRLDHDEGQAA
jgi:hypothetical protein